MTKKERKEGVLRARCEEALEQEITAIAQFKGLDKSDIVRIACRHLVDKFKTAGAAFVL